MAKRNGLMTPEDRELLADLLDGGVLTDDRGGYAMTVLDDLFGMAEQGDERADRVVRAMAYHGVYVELGKHAKADVGVFRDVATGQALNVPKVGGIAVRDTDGALTGVRQLKLWLDMSRAEFVAWAQQQRHHAESLRLKLRGLSRLLDLWDQYPDAVTARDVCERAGIDPDEFEFGDQAA